MRYVDKETFLHIQRTTNGLTEPLWEIGQTYFIGQRKNRFVSFFDHADYPFDQESPESIRRALHHTVMIVRELIFEEVRRDFFPSHPSRHRCIWVIEDNQPDSLEYWRQQLGHGDQILRLSLTGKLHLADARYLEARTDRLDICRQKAFHYWTGTVGETTDTCEMLFEGFARVMDVI